MWLSSARSRFPFFFKLTCAIVMVPSPRSGFLAVAAAVDVASRSGPSSPWIATGQITDRGWRLLHRRFDAAGRCLGALEGSLAEIYNKGKLAYRGCARDTGDDAYF